MISIAFVIEDGRRTDTAGVKIADFSTEEMAMFEELLMEVRDRVERAAAIRAAKTRATGGV